MTATKLDKPFSTVFSTSESLPVETTKKTRKGFFREYLAGIIICTGTFAMGNAGGFTSPVISDLQHPGRTLHFDKEQTSFLGSLMTIGALIGGLTAGIFTDYLGRKTCMIYICCPFVLGWLLIMYSNHVESYLPMLYSGRIICGFCVGILSMCIPNYLSEISSPEIRGALGSCNHLFMNIGILFAYAVGWAVTWSYLALILSTVPILLMMLLLPLPESPAWLIKKKRKLEAVEALEWLRGKNSDVSNEINQTGTKEENNTDKLTKVFFSPRFIKPFILMFMEMFFQQFSGINAIIYNISSIFAAATKRLDPNLSSIIVAIVMVIATFIGVCLIDRIGRRILLISSSIFQSISLMVLGGYYYIQLKDESNAQTISWLPLLCLITFIFTYNIGYGPIPWLMMSEVFPSETKGLATSIITALNWTFAFIITKTYSDLQKAIKNHGVFWFYGIICILSIVYAAICVPETKGKSFQEIQNLFLKGKIIDVENERERF